MGFTSVFGGLFQEGGGGKTLAGAVERDNGGVVAGSLYNSLKSLSERKDGNGSMGEKMWDQGRKGVMAKGSLRSWG